MSHISNEQLVVQYLQGDDRALESLIRRNLAEIYGFVYSYVQKKDEAEDLTQEVFIKIWKNIRRFKTDRKFKTWALTIAKNTCLDFLKKKNRPLPFSELGNEEEGLAFADNLADKTPSVLEFLQKEEGVRELNFALEKIPVEYRRTLALRHEEGLKFREMAELLKEPIDTVKTRYRRAIEQLRELF
jgi:RNA polymerase sigma factor (sigma-70 family)